MKMGREGGLAGWQLGRVHIIWHQPWWRRWRIIAISSRGNEPEPAASACRAHTRRELHHNCKHRVTSTSMQ
jgi:hypothetical protein